MPTHKVRSVALGDFECDFAMRDGGDLARYGARRLRAVFASRYTERDVAHADERCEAAVRSHYRQRKKCVAADLASADTRRTRRAATNRTAGDRCAAAGHGGSRLD